MIPDLGKYHTEVLASYAVTIVLLLGLLAISLIRSRRVARDLAELEKNRKAKNG